jgi:hypothetical protein
MIIIDVMVAIVAVIVIVTVEKAASHGRTGECAQDDNQYPAADPSRFAKHVNSSKHRGGLCDELPSAVLQEPDHANGDDRAACFPSGHRPWQRIGDEYSKLAVWGSGGVDVWDIGPRSKGLAAGRGLPNDTGHILKSIYRR